MSRAPGDFSGAAALLYRRPFIGLAAFAVGFFPVVWLHPFDYPLSSLAAVLVFVGTMVLFARAPRRPVPADD